MSSTREIHKSLVASRPQWRTRAEYLGLLNKSPVDLDLIPSASNMNERTYITLRVLRPEREPAQMFPRFSTELTARAQEHLAKDTQFQAYLNHIGNGEGDVEGQEELGRFQLLRDCQLEIENRLPKDPGIIPGSDSPAVPQVETRNPGPSRRSNRAPRPSSDYNSPSSGSIDSRGGLFLVVGSDQTAASAQEGITFQKAKDEQIVNDSVISLLKALTINIDRVECRWSSHRNPFSSVKLGPEGNTKTLTALADGYLEGKSKPGEVFALVEAKAAIRHRLKNPEVLWQEAAEIVAWIMKSSVGSYPECLNKMIPENKDTENASCRMLISQDRHEIFITIASYSVAYTQYLRGTRGQHPAYLTLYEYGPWQIKSRSHMAHFGRLIVEFCMAISDDERKNLDIPMPEA